MKKNIIFFLLLSNFNLFSQKLIPYRKGNLWGYCNVDKSVVVKPEYDKVSYFIENKPDIVVKNNKVGLMSAKGEILIPVQYKFIKIDDKGYTAFLGTERIFYDENFKKIDLPVEIESEPMEVVQPYEFSEANGKKGLIGKVPVYDEIFDFQINGGRYFTALKDGKYGVINENEKVIIPFSYDFLEPINSISGTSSTLLTGIGKRSLKDGYLKFEGKNGLHSIILDSSSKPRVYLEPKYDLVYLPNTNQYLDDNEYVCISKDGKEYVWSIKTGINYYDE